MTDPEPLPLADLRRWTFLAIRKLQGHPEWEDLLQIGLLGAWKAVRSPSAAGWQLSTVASRGARFAVASYCRSPQALRPKQRGQEEAVAICSLSEIDDHWVSDTPDFTEAILDKIAHEELCSAVKACCTPRQWRILSRHILTGEKIAVIARDEGTTVFRIYQIIQEALAKYRKRNGITVQSSRHRPTATRPVA